MVEWEILWEMHYNRTVIFGLKPAQLRCRRAIIINIDFIRFCCMFIITGIHCRRA